MANYFHESSSISNKASIDLSLKGTHTYIGEGTVIDDFVKIKHVGGTGDVIIGNHVFINSCTVLYSGNGIRIGNNVLIGPNCNFTPVNHNFSDKMRPIRLQGFLPSKGGIIIEDDVWIGANVTILDGAIIKKGAVIGANSLVLKEVEPYSINFGNPLKFLKYR